MFGSWFLLAVVTAVIYGGQAAYLKGATDHIDQMLVTWSLFLFALPLFVASLLYQGIPTVEWQFWPACLVTVSINVAAWPLFVKSVRLSDISLVMPLLAFTPVFILLIEFLLLGATPAGYGLAGILLIVFGAYVLNVREGFSALLDPLRALVSDRGAVYMLIVAAVWSVSGTVEKITVTSSSPSFYLTVFGGLFVVGFVPVLRRFGSAEPGDLKAHWLPLAGAGVLTGAMALIQMAAIKLTPLVNYVISIKRAGMLVSVLFGWLLFDEENPLFRMIGALLMVGGVVLIRVA